MTVFNSKSNYNKEKLFLGNDLGLQRYEQVKYKQFEKFATKQLGFFWQPEEVDVSKDSKDFKKLTEFEQHIFTSNLKRQILLDSVQGRSPNLALLPICSLPEIENWITYWAFNETIHSKSYTHIIRNVYPDPSKVFDEIMSIKEILECSVDVSKYYDDLIEKSMYYNLLGKGKFKIITENNNTEALPPSEIPATNTGMSSISFQEKDCKDINVDIYELKKALWLTIMSVNILEGIRFYVSFACSWAFAELKSMEGNAKIIKLICRDENLHLASTQTLLKLLPQDDKDFVKIKKETEAECIQMFEDAVDQEKAWAHYLFKDGSMIGLNEQLLSDYVEWIANKRMIAVGLPSSYRVPQASPLPWTQKWISGSDVQVAPQETEISSYIVGGTKQDVDDDTFKGFSL